MAILQLENGTKYTEIEDILRELSQLNIQLKYWTVGDNPHIHNLLAKDALTEPEKEQILQSLDNYFLELQQTAGYQSRDLIVLHPEVPNLDSLLSKFNSCHYHTDDEVRYIIAGEGVFGFIRPDTSQVELTVEAEEFINVPANIEHWFHLTPAKRVKVVRYFTGTDGWVPVYTGKDIKFSNSF